MVDDTLVTDAISERILNGYPAEDAFGFCVANAGDVNADGFDYVIVCAPNSDYTAVDAGRAYIYFGGVTFNHLGLNSPPLAAGSLIFTSRPYHTHKDCSVVVSNGKVGSVNKIIAGKICQNLPPHPALSMRRR